MGVDFHSWCPWLSSPNLRPHLPCQRHPRQGARRHGVRTRHRAPRRHHRCGRWHGYPAPGRIVAAGPSATTSFDGPAMRLDMTGLHLYPSFVDVHSDLGTPEFQSAGWSRTPRPQYKKGAYGWNEAVRPETSASAWCSNPLPTRPRHFARRIWRGVDPCSGRGCPRHRRGGSAPGRSPRGPSRPRRIVPHELPQKGRRLRITPAR